MFETERATNKNLNSLSGKLWAFKVKVEGIPSLSKKGRI